MVEVNYDGNKIWVVGIYAPNVTRQHINLWRGEVGQTTSMHCLMDAPEQEVWDLFIMEVLRYDAWTWINGHSVGYTFQFAQYR